MLPKGRNTNAKLLKNRLSLFQSKGGLRDLSKERLRNLEFNYQHRGSRVGKKRFVKKKKKRQ